MKNLLIRQKLRNFVKTDVLRGDFQQNFSIKEVDFIVGGDFSVYRPKSGRDFLDDEGPVSELESAVLADSIMGENIEIEEYGAYVQATLNLPLRTKFVTAIRYDKHSYYDARISQGLRFSGMGFLVVIYDLATTELFKHQVCLTFIC